MQQLPLIVTYIIDDDKLHQFGMRRMLKYIETPVHLLQFYNGLQALEYIQNNMPLLQNMPDVIFLDLNMPIMNGWNFLDAFIQIMPAHDRTPIIYMVTSSVSDSDVEKAATYQQISEYIVKPAGIDQVKQLLKELYSNKIKPASPSLQTAAL